MTTSKKINARKVWPRAQVAHLWAAQSETQTEAREPNGRTSYFNGRTLYSYGSHYVAGHFTTEKDSDGRRLVLVSGSTYSPTTRKVCSARDDALRGLPLCVISTAPNKYLDSQDICGIDARESWTKEDNARTRSRCADTLAEIARDWSTHGMKLYESATRARDPWNISYKLRGFATVRETIARILALPVIVAHKRSAQIVREALADLPAVVPHNPGGYEWTREGRKPTGESWAELADGSRVALSEWPRIARAALKESRAKGAALDAIAAARRAANEYRHTLREYRAEPRLAMQANTHAQAARDALQNAHKLAKAAGIAMPSRGLASADYYTREMKRLNVPVARALVAAHARAMKESERETLRALARGKRWNGTPLSRIKSRTVRDRVRAERKHYTPREWERLAGFNLEDKAASVRRETARALDAGISREPAVLADLRAIHAAHETMCTAMRRARNARDLRALQLDLDTLREYRADFDRFAAMPADELAKLPDGYGSPHNAVRNRDDYYARVRNGAAALVEMPEHFASQVYAVGSMPEIPQNMRDAATLRDGYRMVERVNDSIARVINALNTRQRPSLVRTHLGNLGDHLNAMRGDGNHGGLFAALHAAESNAREVAATVRADAHAYLDAYVSPTRESWIAGGELWDNASRDPVALRVNARGYVETSHGAQVPTDAARMLWRMVARCKRTGKAVHTPPPVEVGAFQLRHIHANGDCQVGCHFIAYAAALEFATAQGWDATAVFPMPEGARAGTLEILSNPEPRA
jgi:hypothetical protein